MYHTGYANPGIEIPMFDGVSFLNANITLGDVSWWRERGGGQELEGGLHNSGLSHSQFNMLGMLRIMNAFWDNLCREVFLF